MGRDPIAGTRPRCQLIAQLLNRTSTALSSFILKNTREAWAIDDALMALMRTFNVGRDVRELMAQIGHALIRLLLGKAMRLMQVNACAIAYIKNMDARK